MANRVEAIKNLPGWPGNQKFEIEQHWRVELASHQEKLAQAQL